MRLGEVIEEYSSRNRDSSCNDVCSVTNSQGFVSSTEYFDKEVFSKNLSTYKIVEPGMFAYNPSRINVGSVACYHGKTPVVVSPLYVVFSIDPQRIDSDYLDHYLHCSIANRYIRMLTAGSVRDSLKFSSLCKVELPLPPLPTQRAIAEELDRICELKRTAEKLVEKYRLLIKAKFSEMFGSSEEMGKWALTTVGDVASVCVGVVIKPTQYYCEHGIKAFRSLNVGAMKIKAGDWVYFTDEGHQRNKKSVVREGDVLVVRSGAPGTACVVSKEYDGCNAVDIIIARPDKTKIDSLYLAMFTNMPHGKNQIDARVGGAAQQHFNVGGYKAVMLPLPPLPLQREFAAFVEKVEKLEQVAKETVEKYDLLYRSKLQEYFG